MFLVIVILDADSEEGEEEDGGVEREGGREEARHTSHIELGRVGASGDRQTGQQSAHRIHSFTVHADHRK